MKRIAAWIASVGSLLATGLAHADCPPGSITITTPSAGTYSIGFAQMVATQGSPAQCNGITIATGVGAGVVAVYSAEYRGAFDDPNGTGRLTIEHDGMTESSTALADPLIFGNLYYRHLIGTNAAGDLVPSICGRLSILSLPAPILPTSKPPSTSSPPTTPR